MIGPAADREIVPVNGMRSEADEATVDQGGHDVARARGCAIESFDHLLATIRSGAALVDRERREVQELLHGHLAARVADTENQNHRQNAQGQELYK